MSVAGILRRALDIALQPDPTVLCIDRFGIQLLQLGGADVLAVFKRDSVMLFFVGLQLVFRLFQFRLQFGCFFLQKLGSLAKSLELPLEILFEVNLNDRVRDVSSFHRVGVFCHQVDQSRIPSQDSVNMGPHLVADQPIPDKSFLYRLLEKGKGL